MHDKIKPIQLVLCWHMHQPEYRDLSTGQYQLPWTYLHAIKDYTDMVGHLEMEPDARAVINFAPILLEQIKDYSNQIEAWLRDAHEMRDPLLNQLVADSLPVAPETRMWIAHSCLKSNHERMIEPWPMYKGLVDIVQLIEKQDQSIDYISDQFLFDLLVWYHLSWMGEFIRRSDVRIKRLIEKGKYFTFDDRKVLIEVIGENLSRLLDRYKVLSKQGRIELSMSPYGHPIVPLIIDLKSARDAWAEVKLPDTVKAYPDGKSRVKWHIERGLSVFEDIFDELPAGCWPSEGSISKPTLDLFDSYGLTWSASGETVLANSLQSSGEKIGKTTGWLYNAYQSTGNQVCCFFRDDKLSDAIGFTYSSWHGDDAAANFVHELELIADESKESDSPQVVSVILDGENAWEYYPSNGYYFLSRLYELLANHPRIQMTTFTDVLSMTSKDDSENAKISEPNKEVASCKIDIKPLKKIIAGSWVYGTFSTWIGDHDKNQGWKMLIDAKKAYDAAVKSKRLSPAALERATQQLAVCEGSDWCWWFGDYNPSESVSDFEQLYRLHLSNLYSSLGLTPPEYLKQTFTFGGGNPETGGAMRRGKTSD